MLVGLPLAIPTSICRNKVTICSGLYLLMAMTSFPPRWILSFHVHKKRRSRHPHPSSRGHTSAQKFARTLASYRGQYIHLLTWQPLLLGLIFTIYRKDHSGQRTLKTYVEREDRLSRFQNAVGNRVP